MIDYKVEIDGIDIKSIVDIRFHKGVNEHGDATIRGIVTQEEADKLFNLKADVTFVSIKIATTEGGDVNQTIFEGIVYELATSNERGVPEVELKLIGSSVLLDVIKKTRTYQKEEAEYQKIVDYIKGEENKKKVSDAEIMINNGEGCKVAHKPANELLVQYQETDYAFLKRCASLQEKPLITTLNATGSKIININVGLVKGGSESLDAKYYKQKKQLKDYINDKNHGLDSAKEDDYSVVEVRAREYFDLGAGVNIAGKTLYVYAVDSTYDSSIKTTGDGNKDEFWHTYTLADEKRFKAAPIYNYEMIGASLQATVKEVVKDKIKVDTDIDEENNTKAKNNLEFPFATVYSTNDGTGWYCMPEEKDKVRLYLPTEKEDDAYVISAVHLEAGSNLRDKPDTKFIMNKHKKKVEFTKDAITITNGDKMEIKLDDNKGISIISNKDINISAEKEVNIISKKNKVNVSGKNSVTLKQGATAYVELKGKATIKATSVHM